VKRANGAAMFGDGEVDLPLLRQRAHNLRWATVPEGVIPLTAADPDFRCAPEIAEAVARYTSERLFCYGPPQGLLSFREVVARTLRERHGVSTSPDLVLPVDSAAQGLFVVTRFCLEPGDEAIIFDPVDFLFERAVLEARGKPVRLPIEVASGDWDFEYLKSLITPRTRLICLCNPHNPSGKVFSREELLAIGELAVENDLWILSDEIWCDIVFAPRVHTSLAALERAIADRTFTVYGFSKAFGLAGLRVGFIVSPDPLSHAGVVEASLVETTACGVSTLSQVAAQAAFESAWYWVDAFVEHLTRLRDITVDRLNDLPGVTCHLPQGTYLAFPDIRATRLTSHALCNHLLKKARVALVPGDPQWFGPRAAGHVRLCFSTSEGVLLEALDRIGQAWPEI
jgi:aspartate/methionine/tyrosine aminotransferase